MTPKAIWPALALAALAGCAPDSMPEPAEGRALYLGNCAVCHGIAGRGDGPAAAGLDPAPSDLTAISRRAGGAYPTAHVLTVIDGYTRMDLPGQDMPEFGALLMGDTVPVALEDGSLSPVPRPLAALTTYLESIQE